MLSPTTPDRVRRRASGRPPSPVAWGHRPALDALRVLAVYLVVAFHGGVDLFAGGFVGVDLFFVLSGFLVTNVLLEEQAVQGRIRLGRFYARRVKRLLPASAVTILVTAAAFVLVAPPADRQAVLGGARASFLYFANWHFLGEANDYFAVEEAPSPFLHFWSLAIEEQFYLVFPLVVLALLALGRRGSGGLLVAGLGGLFAGGLAVQLLTARSSELEAYYGTHARLYQLLAGATLAALLRHLPAVRRAWPRPGLTAIMSSVGLVLVASSAADLNPSTRGILAMAASVGMIGSLEARPDGSVARWLDRPQLTYLGRISYGTYLWHWPVVVLTARVFEVSPIMMTVISAVMGTALASLSDQLLESPVRTSAWLADRHRSVIAMGLTGSLLCGIVVVPQILERERATALRSQGPPVVLAAAVDEEVPADVPWEAARDDTPVEPVCLDAPSEECVVVRGDGPHLHLVGDSHAKTVLPLFEELATSRGWTFSATVTGACPWQRGLLYRDNEERTQRCLAHQPDWYDRVIPELDPDVVILFHRGLEDPAFPRNMQTVDPELADLDQREMVRRLSESTVDDLVGDGRRVVILEPLPIAAEDPTRCLSGARMLSECAFEQSLPHYVDEAAFRYADAISDAVWSIDLDPLVCPDLPVCLPMVDGLVVRRDRHHITGTFARSISDDVARILDERGVFAGL